jgi:hypothetical protein
MQSTQRRTLISGILYRGAYGAIVLLAMLALSCDTTEPGPDLSVTVTLEEGDNAGCQIFCPAGAYGGSVPLSISAGSTIAAVGDSVDGHKILALVGPPVKMSPSTTFISPVTLWLPFSVETYNAAIPVGTKAIAIIAQNDETSPVRLDTGPINMPSIAIDTGPINLGQDAVSLDTGPIAITANTDNKTHNALFSLKVAHFTTFQVVAVEKQ